MKEILHASKSGRSDPAGARPSFYWPRPRTVAERRHETLRRFGRLKKTHTAVKAASIVGASIPTLWRWQKKFAARGLAGLTPIKPPGPRSPFARIRFTAKAMRELELLFLEKRDLRIVWRQFANCSPACPPMVADFVQRTGRPPRLLADIGRVSLVQARCYVSEDGRRLFVKLPVHGALMARVAVPPKFKLAKVKTA